MNLLAEDAVLRREVNITEAELLIDRVCRIRQQLLPIHAALPLYLDDRNWRWVWTIAWWNSRWGVDHDKSVNSNRVIHSDILTTRERQIADGPRMNNITVGDTW
jgi:hypothetical protein